MESSKRELIESVFAGDGEMATRMRALDWSATPLGPVEQWPLALRVSHPRKACRNNCGDCSNAYASFSPRTNSSECCWSQEMSHLTRDLPR